MIDLAVRPRGQYSLALSAAGSSDATRMFRDGVLTCVLRAGGRAEPARAWQLPDGTVQTFSALTNGYLTRMEDRFGNFVQVDYFDCPSTCSAVAPSAAHAWRITDTQGCTHWIRLRDTFRSERYFGKFHRSVTLPAAVDANKVNATYKDGILTIELPKAEEAKPKQIAVNVS